MSQRQSTSGVHTSLAGSAITTLTKFVRSLRQPSRRKGTSGRTHGRNRGYDQPGSAAESLECRTLLAATVEVKGSNVIVVTADDTPADITVSQNGPFLKITDNVNGQVWDHRTLGFPDVRQTTLNFIGSEAGDRFVSNVHDLRVSAAGHGGDDHLEGASAGDTLSGGAGNDTLLGSGGNDILIGGSGQDHLDGGAQNDWLDGDAGNDSLFGGDGEDTMNGGSHDDVLDGGRDDDSMSGGDGNDTLWGFHGNDRLQGDHVGTAFPPQDTNTGNDLLVGGIGDDVLSGNDGDDYLVGGVGNDTLLGDKGDDSLYGMEDNDLIFGGEDDDLLHGNDGIDRLFGMGGNDSLFAGIEDNETLNGGQGADRFLVVEHTERNSGLDFWNKWRFRVKDRIDDLSNEDVRIRFRNSAEPESFRADQYAAARWTEFDISEADDALEYLHRQGLGTTRLLKAANGRELVLHRLGSRLTANGPEFVAWDLGDGHIAMTDGLFALPEQITTQFIIDRIVFTYGTGAQNRVVESFAQESTVQTIIDGINIVEIASFDASTAGDDIGSTLTLSLNAANSETALPMDEPQSETPDATEPDVTEPDVTEPDAIEPDVTELVNDTPPRVQMRMDIDGDGNQSALTDGILALRFLANFTDDALVNGVVNPVGQRTTAKGIAEWLGEQVTTGLDIDGDGSAMPLTDGILLIRYLAGFRGDTLVAGAVNPQGLRTTADSIDEWFSAISDDAQVANDAGTVVAPADNETPLTFLPPVTDDVDAVFSDPAFAIQ